MAQTPLVTYVVDQSTALNRYVASALEAQVLRALLIDDDGDWRLVVVTEDQWRRGRLAMARHLYNAADDALFDSIEDLSRVIFLDVDDPDAMNLLMPVRADSNFREPIRVGDFSASIAHVLWRSPRATARFNESALDEIADELEQISFEVVREYRLASGWRADLLLRRGDKQVILEFVSAERRSWRSRLREAAGVANIAGLPVVLVVRSSEQLPDDMLSPVGVVPVLVVDWEMSGIAAVVAASEFLA